MRILLIFATLYQPNATMLLILFLGLGCNTRNRVSAENPEPNSDTTRVSSDVVLKDNSISIKEVDTVDINGYRIYFSKCDSVFIPPLFKDQKKRQQIVDTLGNSWDRAKAIEKYLQGKNQSYFRATDSTLTLLLENGKKLVLPKWDSARDMGNNFENYFQKENYYLIYNQFVEGGSWMLVNRKNGFLKYIIGEPFFSPNQKRILSINEDLLSELSLTGIQLLEVSGDTLVSKFTIQVKNWGPVGVRWINDSAAKLEVKILTGDPYPDHVMKGFMRMELRQKAN